MDKTKKILICGSNGLIGIPLTKLLKKKFSVFTTYHNTKMNADDTKIDILSSNSLEKTFELIKPDIVINLCAIYKNLDFCEKNKKLVMAINGKSLKTISKLANKYNSFLLGISSDFVFDGQTGNYKENDQINPINYYGETKVEGEKNIQSIANNYCIIRTSLIYGKNPIRNTISDMIFNALKKEEKLELTNDRFSTPTYLQNFCEMLFEIIDIEYKGIIHLAGPEKISRYNFAKKLFDLSDFTNSNFVPISGDKFEFSKKMPKDSSLNTQKATVVLKKGPENIESSIKKYLKDKEQNYI